MDSESSAWQPSLEDAVREVARLQARIDFFTEMLKTLSFVARHDRDGFRIVSSYSRYFPKQVTDRLGDVLTEDEKKIAGLNC